ncbi:hypothetical protein SUGI_1488630 [Cryptomeria japonica]|uniref:Uncharacterized protein n=1 Tax=Cryptomeria japonica TaxID=3369 RepID=A0AAD3RRB8_CRYJA|nr:hypothetical protein SUGI_1488630 [Cryptomeria japonica]
MLNNQQRDNQQQQHQQQQQQLHLRDHWAPRTSSASRKAEPSTNMFGGGTKLSSPGELVVSGMMCSNLDSVGSEATLACSNERLAISVAAQQVAASTASVKTASQQTNQQTRETTSEFGGSGVGSAEFRLCEHCQLALIQRRSTMASGSSNSSLASSNESQWSISGLGQNNNSSTNNTKCSCSNRSNRSSLVLGGLNNPLGQQRPQQLSGSSNLLLGSTGSQRNSASASARSASIMSATTPTHFGSLSSRQSQSQHLSMAQKSSTYLMLASLSLYDLLLFTLNELIEFDQASTVPLKRGLYLGFVQLQTTVESMRLLVPRARPNMVPCARIRDNAHVSKEEWQYLKKFESHGRAMATSTTAAATLTATATTTTSSSSRLAAARTTTTTTTVAEKMPTQQTSCTLSVRTSDPSIWSVEMLSENSTAGEINGQRRRRRRRRRPR